MAVVIARAWLPPRYRRRSKLLGEREGQSAFALEQLLQPPVTGTAGAPDDTGRNQFPQFAAMTAAFQPVFVTD